MTTINTRDINACYPKGWGPTASVNDILPADLQYDGQVPYLTLPYTLMVQQHNRLKRVIAYLDQYYGDCLHLFSDYDDLIENRKLMSREIRAYPEGGYPSVSINTLLPDYMQYEPLNRDNLPSEPSRLQGVCEHYEYLLLSLLDQYPVDQVFACHDWDQLEDDVKHLQKKYRSCREEYFSEWGC